MVSNELIAGAGVIIGLNLVFTYLKHRRLVFIDRGRIAAYAKLKQEIAHRAGKSVAELPNTFLVEVIAAHVKKERDPDYLDDADAQKLKDFDLLQSLSIPLCWAFKLNADIVQFLIALHLEYVMVEHRLITPDLVKEEKDVVSLMEKDHHLVAQLHRRGLAKVEMFDKLPNDLKMEEARAVLERMGFTIPLPKIPENYGPELY